MSTRGGILHASEDMRAQDAERTTPRLPSVIYVLALGTFLMGTSEFIVAGLLPEMAADLQVSTARAGLLITVFALGMIVGAPLLTMLMLRLPRRLTLVLALGVFTVGHVVVAISSDFTVLMAARFLTAMATGAFWAVATVVAAHAAGPDTSSRAMGIVGSGAMLANVIGVPLGAFAGQLAGWRGPFWALAALSAAAMLLLDRHVPRDHPDRQSVSIRAELMALRSRRLWLTLAACAATHGGVLSTYSYIVPLLTDRTHLAAGLVPLVLLGFGGGALTGFLIGGRLGDVRPFATTVTAATAATIILLAICLLSGFAVPTVLLLVLLGLFGLGANPVLMSLVVRFAGKAPTLGSALTVSAFNLGTAASSWIAGLALDSALGPTGPALIGTAFAALSIMSTVALSIGQRHRSATAAV
ncbi:MFS transporter [Streptomyces sp. bgisy027]|uniref:MFS transporter n=1 Tax=unclassified Streptomyces TaxID=2593676 RepID=UPI003D70F9DF